MNLILKLLTAFVALWGAAALAGFLFGMIGIVRDGFGDPPMTVGLLLLLLCIGTFATTSIYSVWSFWKHWNGGAAERILFLTAFYGWVTFMMTYPFEAGAADLQRDPERFPVETFLFLASVPVTFLIYRFLQERTRRYFGSGEAEPIRDGNARKSRDVD